MLPMSAAAEIQQYTRWRLIVTKALQHSADPVTTEFQTSSGINTTTKTATEWFSMAEQLEQNPYLTKRNAQRRMQRCKAPPLDSTAVH